MRVSNGTKLAGERESAFWKRPVLPRSKETVEMGRSQIVTAAGLSALLVVLIPALIM